MLKPNPYSELFEVPFQLGQLPADAFFRYAYFVSDCRCIFQVVGEPIKPRKRGLIYVRMSERQSNCIIHRFTMGGWIDKSEMVYHEPNPILSP